MPKPGDVVAPTSRASLRLPVRFVLPAHEPGQRPVPPLPFLAVLGRSNVGKSSLLNAVLGVKVAKVSQSPGRTQALYWYRVGEEFDLVDCPGYGYAKTGLKEREAFADLIETLLTAPPPPALALLLVDGRHEPQASDQSMALFLRNHGIPVVVAATKWDAVKPSLRVRQKRALETEYGPSCDAFLCVSAETGENLKSLLNLIRSRLSSPAFPPREEDQFKKPIQES
ncbi:MAG: ribosome biogenesis GTP-binding protein YihA/YsxC [Thermoanaerobaculia bacterium]|nr:ribosome biogenesis GTP-binding protein YihA/YsxC [Thermoanaerobaculia bacterium]